MGKKKHWINLLDLVMWKLNPISLGDTVRLNKDKRRIGRVTGMFIPMSLSGKKNEDIELYERTDYVVTFKVVIRNYKRWEIERV